MPQSFNCPNCSAPLHVEESGATTLRCPYCDTTVIIPEEIRVPASNTKAASPRQPSFNPPLPIDRSEKLESIRELAASGDKMGAIKQMRSTFEVGLKEAADMVEAMHRGEQVDTSQLKLLGATSGQFPRLDSATIQQIVDLINSGDKIGAIKLFRDATGVDLKDAKEAVDGMEAGLSSTHFEYSSVTSSSIPNSPSPNYARPTTGVTRAGGSCLLVGFILFMLLVTVVPILIGMTSRGGPLAGVWAKINPFSVGRVTLAFGNEGTGPGYFTDARFVSVDNNGHIFVGEFNGGRVQVFDDNGKYLTQWKATGEGTGDIYLSGMSVDRNAAVYAVVGSQLYVYDGLTGTLLGRLDHPEGWGFDDVTVAPDGSIVAAWYKNEDDIIRFDRNGQIDLLLENAIGSVTSDSEMDMRVAVDGIGNIYALAYFNQSVFVFSPDGRYITRFGSEGDAKGQFTSPRSIVVDNLGRIYIADFPGVMIYASDGRYLDTLSVNGAVMGMAFDDQNNLYLVADDQVLRFKLK